MIPDPIIEDLHRTREKILEECKAKGVSLLEHYKNMKLPEGLKRANLKPASFDRSKLRSLVKHA